MKKILLFILLIFIKYVDAQIISTIAGNGIQGDSGDAGAAISCELLNPDGIAIDKHGNLYICSAVSNSIRKISSGTGIITTIAGNGSVGYSGDGGSAINATFGGPVGLATDTSGNLFIADVGNNCIRKVTASTGIITTIAGNTIQGYSGDSSLAINAEFNSPTTIALDKYENIYIADTYNSCIRKITKTTGIITTVAGNNTFGFAGDGGQATSATFNVPFGVAVDSSGNIYVADYQNFRVRKVDISTGIINTIAGNNVSAYSGDGGLANNAGLVQPFCMALDKYQNIYIVDESDNRIRKITSSTNIIATVAGNGIAGYNGDGIVATNAEINNPSGVIIDTAGNIYIADLQNQRIRMVNNNGTTNISYLNKTTNQLNIYPNPANNKIISDANDVLDVKLFDVLGKQIFASKQNQIDVSNLPDGVYFIQVQTNTSTTTQKIMVQH